MQDDDAAAADDAFAAPPWFEQSRAALLENDEAPPPTHCEHLRGTVGGYYIPSQNRYAVVTFSLVGITRREVVAYSESYDPGDSHSKAVAEFRVRLASNPVSQYLEYC